jgi:prepilin-type N-terminal cleavage/methylation domain-containing protein
MCATPPAPDPGARRAGFSLLEMLVVLAVLALAAAIVLPRGSVMLDRAAAHSVFFDFQRQVSDLRLEAWRTETPLLLTDPAARSPGARTIALKGGWTYRLDRTLQISDGGACPPAQAQLLKNGRPVVRLASTDGLCHFRRLE